MMRVWMGTVVIGSILSASVFAQESRVVAKEDSKPTRPADEAAIKAAAQEFAKAFATGNEKSLTALFTDEAEYVDENREAVRGREALAKAYAAFFAKRKQVAAESKTEAIRFLGSDTAVEEGVFSVKGSGGPPTASRYSALYVRQNGKWLIALLKEWSDPVTSAPKLDDLAWLIGVWESTGPEATAKTTYEWAAEKKFIKSTFTITKKKDAKTESGVQVIGIDPASGQIRGWLFASDGGIGESTWTWEGDRWVIASSATLADGTPSAATNLLSRSGDDAFTWRSVQRSVGGEAQPDVAPVTVKRVAATSSAAPKK